MIKNSSLLLGNNKMLPYITNHLNCSNNRVYKKSDLANILSDLRARNLVSSARKLPEFIKMLMKKTELKMVKLSFPKRNETRYIWGNLSPYELALSLRPNSYLSHQTAAFVNGLIDKQPEIIYVNQEQPLKRISPGDLSQERIDLAFKNQPRVSKMTAKYDDWVIWFISGMYTGQYGVIEVVGKK